MGKGAFEGIKVADFTWAGVGPLIVKYLADNGATAVRLESMKRPDWVRISGPYKDGKPGIDRSCYWAYLNPNRLSMALNLAHPKGREIAKQFISWADVVAENYTVGTMEKWGLGYEEVKKIKPDIIMLRTSNQGQTGPHATHPGFGIQLVGLVGFPQITGWPDREPSPMPVAYTDLIAPRFGAAALIAALDYREKTGKGQLLDLSQLEAALNFMTPVVLDYVVNGRESMRAGNQCPSAAPHGVYRCKGDDRWCAIAIFTDKEWKAFCTVLENPPWTQARQFSTFLSRKANEEELDKLIEEWTVNFTPEEVMERMQQKGVAAGVVKNAADIYQDPQLKMRNYLWELNHREMGPVTHMGQAFVLSRTPAEGRKAAPCLGEHTEYVCREILGMSDEEFVALYNEGVLE
ncbi:MAG: CoA transferase [Thermodesulfobacteriota bacterium]|nr:CoA transferase [Thermodesulfobacteriota bacterium]